MRARSTPWPSSYRGRIAVVIAAALLAVTLGVLAPAQAILNAQVRAAVEATLRDQAAKIAETVEATPDEQKGNRASDAARFLPDTRVVVTWPGAGGGLYFQPIARNDIDAKATAQSGEVTVTLERPSAPARLSRWLFALLVFGGIAVTAALIWSLATAVGRRLRHQAGNLAASAEAVGAGDLTVHAEESDDELGRAARAFNRMTERLSEVDARQRRFLADIAHELRTPVTAIDGFATALTDGTARTPEDQADAAEFIRHEATRLRELITDLRQLTTLDLEPARRLGEHDLTNIANATLTRLGPAAKRVGVQLAGPANPAPFVTDPAHLEVVMSNLVANAINATKRGGRVTVGIEVTDDEANITVRDTGIGISAEHIPHIFDRLYRVSRSRFRDSTQGGTGLGLAIVKTLIDRLEGAVTVQSTVGVGSTFTVRLPALSAAGIANEPRSNDERP